MAEPGHTSAGRALTIVAILAVVIVGFMILRPRLWVKNKTAKLIVDGRLSEDVKLFHGSDDRLLFYLKDDPGAVYYFSDKSGVLRCAGTAFVSLKVLAFSTHSIPECPAEATTAIIREQSLEYSSRGHATVISWQPAPR